MWEIVRRPSALIAGALVVASAVTAVLNGRLTNLLIGAAMVACLVVAIIAVGERTVAQVESAVEDRLNDAYDSGKVSERHAIVRDLAEYIEQKKQRESGSAPVDLPRKHRGPSGA